MNLQQCADAGYQAYSKSIGDVSDGAPTPCVAFARAAIETYLKLNPVWVRASERMPTEEDADSGGWVWVYALDLGVEFARWQDLEPHYLWTSIKHLPPPPDPFEDWLAKQPDDVREADKELVRKIFNSIKP